jgi:rhamnogalacturonan endolyase
MSVFKKNGFLALLTMFVTSCLIASKSFADAPVSISSGGRGVELSNGIITADINVAGAEISAMKFEGHEMVSVSGRHQRVYFSRDGAATYETPSHCIGSITTQTPDTIDYSCKHTYSPQRGDKAPWDIDVHFVIRRGVSGIYVYVVNTHPVSYPTLNVGEWRMVWSPAEDRNDFLDTIYIDQARHWKIPTPADFATAQAVPGAPKEVTLLTAGSWAGRMDCKYMYAASYFDIRTWGFASSDKHIGSFVVLPSTECFNDGPNKQDLTAAVGTILLHMNMNHYDGTGFQIKSGRQWSKFYGPFLLYCTSKSTGDDCWRDAQERVKTEAAQWPYDWVKNSDYPSAAQRGDVKGRLVIHDSLKPQLTGANAMIGLSPPGEQPNTDFQFEATGYQFWTHADEDGKFEIAHVRPGTYNLYIYTNGIVSQFEKANIQVRAGQSIAMNDVVWNVQHPGRSIAWEIGVPDRTAAEFGHGKDYYLPLMYKKLEAEIPNPLEFTIGKSDPSTDWYYEQSRSDHGGPSKWNIHFNLKNVPAGPATLTLAFAGADHARIGVDANNSHVATVTPPVQGGNGLVREAVHAKYSFSYVPIPAGHLHAGENTISLTQESSGDVMYDYLNLELP